MSWLTYMKDESGAITVDFVSLTASAIMLGIATMATIYGATENASEDILTSLNNLETTVTASGDDWFDNIGGLSSGSSPGQEKTSVQEAEEKVAATKESLQDAIEAKKAAKAAVSKALAAKKAAKGEAKVQAKATLKQKKTELKAANKAVKKAKTSKKKAITALKKLKT